MYICDHLNQSSISKVSQHQSENFLFFVVEMITLRTSQFTKMMHTMQLLQEMEQRKLILLQSSISSTKRQESKIFIVQFTHCENGPFDF